MTPDEKEEQYQRMGLPSIKRKKLHFKSIEFFSKCVLKYFKPIVTKVLTEEQEGYGGMRDVLTKFHEKICEKLKEDPDIGVNGRQPRL